MVLAQQKGGPSSRKLPVALAALICCGAAIAQTSGYFTIRVVDDWTGRGVPLVALRTTNEIPDYTDSNGIVAFYEPGLMVRLSTSTLRATATNFQKIRSATGASPSG